MKRLAVIILCLSAFTAFCQENQKIKHIDSLIAAINQSNLRMEYDTITNDMPAYGMFIKTYVTLAVADTSLRKYEQQVFGVRTNSDKTDTTRSSNTFYFYDNKLVKVAEWLIQDKHQGEIDWYFWDDKSFHHIIKKAVGMSPGFEERLSERPNLLLMMAAGMLKSFQNGK